MTDWIKKKEPKTEWIKKKEPKTEWISKKKKWVSKKSPAEIQDRGRVRKAGGGRTNLLEELGRVEGESSNRNRRAEVSRIHGELNRGYKHGGPVGAAKRGFNKKILRKD
jgi:hypothetical protein